MVMAFWRVYRAPLFFMGVVILGAILTLRQTLYNEIDHMQKREDFILLYERGYTKKAEWYYPRLVQELGRLSERALWEDYHRTIHLVDPDQKGEKNLIRNYHWAVKNQLLKRAQDRLQDLLASEEEP